ncbi:MAG TPA: HAD-IIIC family phosphatase [Steroidobacteraceae bacterium]|nr:HAD-IIIC family phosphatase [Steroidobacteraceae bacterium]
MSVSDLPVPSVEAAALRCLTVTASFTAEPLVAPLAYLLEALGCRVRIDFAPYNQVLQQLLDPSSLLARNRGGVGAVLLRPQDWLRAAPQSGLGDGRALEQRLREHAQELLEAVRSFLSRSDLPLTVAVCPAAPATETGAAAEPLRTISEWLERALREVPGVAVIGAQELALYPLERYHDARRDRLGHIPYNGDFFGVLATLIARRVHAALSAPFKVIVVDCDNTLWKGVVGEDGVEGISLPEWSLALQRLLIEQVERGFLLCLCSKNQEGDVLQVLEQRTDMLLKRQHLVAWRVNWLPKSQNLRALAQELNLGLDSFIFIDDNPVECAEVSLTCPEILTLNLPAPEHVARFLRHIWAFDRRRITSEDRQRTDLYRQEADRARFQRESGDFARFIAELGLQVSIAAPRPEQIARVAQLTQRTNQFNFTTRRRSESEIRDLSASQLECRAVEVSDRFGSYGLVGVMIFGSRADALELDTLLLSCRVLGRGVEHRMIRELGTIAMASGLAHLSVRIAHTKKNQPARDFMESVARAHARAETDGTSYWIPAEEASRLEYHPGTAAPADQPMSEAVTSAQGRPGAGSEAGSARVRMLARLACELSDTDLLCSALRANRRYLERPLPTPLAPTSNAIESALLQIWSDVLGIKPVGADDDFFALGGSSLQAVDVIDQVEARFGTALSLSSLIESPTVRGLAALLVDGSSTTGPLLLRAGAGGVPLFLVHDGDGEVLLYRNLALRLSAEHAVYGLQPRAACGQPLAATRIADMAAYHIERIRAIQPRGPYLLGGMCAGGVIAYEMARQLHANGQQVALVVLLDAAEPSAPQSGRAGARLQRALGVLRQGSVDPWPQRVGRMLAQITGKAVGFTKYEVSSRLKRLRDHWRMRVLRWCLDRGRAAPRFLGRIPVRTAYLFAESGYRPQDVLHAELLLVRASEGIGPDEPYVTAYEDPLLGWGRRASAVNVVDVPGGHSSMLQEPHVAVLASRLQAVIDEALGRHRAHELRSSGPQLERRREIA